jgi:aspartate/methionine/tyrosine aminotransferase
MDFSLLKNNTPLFNALSDLGRRIFLPDGIFHWSGRAKKEADIIGTIGTAFGYEKDFIQGGSERWVPLYLDMFKNYTSLDITSIVPYASIGGLSELREKWKEWIIFKAGYDKATDAEKIQNLQKYTTLPLVTQGITNALFMIGSVFLNSGEYLISPNKRWGNYDNIFSKHINAKIKSFDFFKDHKFNIDGFEDAIVKVAKEQDKIIIILNFPNNPTGYTPTKIERDMIIEKLANLQKKLDIPIIVLVDDAYEPYIYDEGIMDHSIFYELMELEENVIPIKLDGISKELLAYGGRVGFITMGLKPSWIVDEELEQLKAEINNKLEGMNRSSISNTNHFYQAVVLKMFQKTGFDEIVQKREQNRLLLEKRYELINNELKNIDVDFISVDPNSGGFFLFINLDPEKMKATEFADYLLKNYKVGVIPIEKPEENINGIRIAYCSVDISKITEMVELIKQALDDF